MYGSAYCSMSKPFQGPKIPSISHILNEIFISWLQTCFNMLFSYRLAFEQCGQRLIDRNILGKALLTIFITAQEKRHRLSIVEIVFEKALPFLVCAQNVPVTHLKKICPANFINDVAYGGLLDSMFF